MSVSMFDRCRSAVYRGGAHRKSRIMPKKPPKADDAISLGQLEETLESLEALVEKLESGELPLEEAVREFERGIRLTRQCQTVLKDAGQKVEILLEESAEPVPFEADEED